MKKLFISLIVVIIVLGVAFIAQVFYASSLNEKIYTQLENSLQNQKFFALKQSLFEKGFLTSHAKITLVIAKNDELGMTKDLDEMPLDMELEFKNNFLSSNLLSASLKTPEFLQKTFNLKPNLLQLYFDKGLLSAPVLKIVLEDIDFKTSQQSAFGVQNLNVKLEGAQMLAHLNQNYQFTDAIFDIKKISMENESRFNSVITQLDDFNAKTLYNKPFSFDEYLKSPYTVALESSMSAQTKALKISSKDGEITLNNIQSTSISNTDEINLSLDNNLSIASFKIAQNNTNLFDIKDFALDFNASNISKEAYLQFLSLAQMSDELLRGLGAEFLAAKPSADFNVEFKINEKDIASKGFVKSLGAQDFELDIKTSSSALPSDIFPLLALVGADDYFVQKGNVYESSYHILKEGKNAKISLNGNEIVDSFKLDENLNDENFNQSNDENLQNLPQNLNENSNENAQDENMQDENASTQDSNISAPKTSEEALQNLLNEAGKNVQNSSVQNEASQNNAHIH